MFQFIQQIWISDKDKLSKYNNQISTDDCISEEIA